MSEFFVHPNGLCESARIGSGTRIWAFAHVLPLAVIGSDCNICDGVFVENDVIVGNFVTVKCGVQLWDGVRIEDNVFIGPNATFTNDPFPRSRIYPEAYSKHCCTAWSICWGQCHHPARHRNRGGRYGGRRCSGYKKCTTKRHRRWKSSEDCGLYRGGDKSCQTLVKLSICRTQALGTGLQIFQKTDLGVGEAALYQLKLIVDLRGALTVGEFGLELPFKPNRYFVVFDVPTREIRGEHAHRKCHQFLICIKGSCRVLLDNGKERCDVLLDRPILVSTCLR